MFGRGVGSQDVSPPQRDARISTSFGSAPSCGSGMRRYLGAQPSLDVRDNGHVLKVTERIGAGALRSNPSSFGLRTESWALKPQGSESLLDAAGYIPDQQSF